MPVTSRGNPYPTGGSPATVHTDIQALATALDDAPRYGAASLAGRPGVGPTKRFYVVTDAKIARVSFNTGSEWLEMPVARSGALADRPTAADAARGAIWIDERGTHWRSTGTNWELAG